MKFFRPFIILWFALYASGLVAQNHWARRVGAWSNEAYTDVAIDAQGFLYAVGEFGGNIELDPTTTLISQGSLDVLVAKYDPNGVLVWTRTFGGPGLDRAVRIALTSDGNIAVVGQFMGAASFDGTMLVSQNGTQDMFVLKMAQSDGAVAWARQGGSPDGVDQPNGVSVGPDGSIAVAGEFRGNAVFDQGTLSSIIDPDNGQPSVDIFLATYASDGTPLWLQQGAAEFADRGMDVVHDLAGNLYLTGQFSDTITFDQTHVNAMYSAIFIARFSSTGEEEWFRIFGGGTYNQVFEMLLVEDHLMLVGDVQGTVIFLDTEPDLFTAVEPRSSFLVEVGLDGELIRQTTWGSDNAVNTRALSVQGDDIAVFGRFGCQFTGFSAGYGNGTFLSTGPYDLYIARFRYSDLAFKEAQQFGGQGDKVPGGIVHTLDSTYVFAGSYERLLVFPDDGSLMADPTGPLIIPGAPSPYCSDANYAQYANLRGSALKDAFIARGYVDSREPYDMFNRSGAVCDRSARDVILRVGVSDGVVGPDSAARCVNAYLSAFTHTSYTPDTSLRHTAPDLLFLWSTGQTVAEIIATVSGWYWVNVSSAAGCWQRTDSVHLTINPLPPQLLFNDDVVVNTNAHPPEPVAVCEPQQPWLWISGQPPENTITWSGPGGSAVSDSIQTFVTGIYSATATTPAGCTRSNLVPVTIFPNGPLPPIEAEFTLSYPQDLDLNDTLELCRNALITTAVHVDLTLNGVPVGIPYGVTAYYACGSLFDDTPDLDFECFDILLEEGWYVSNIAFMLTNRPCGEDSLLWFITDSIYVIPFPVSDPIVSVAGPALICPGDTVALTAICVGCDVGAWTGPNIMVTAIDTAWIIGPGIYEFTGTVVDTNGCSTSATAAIEVDWNPQPLLAVDPLDGIICPNATATIWSEWEGVQYQWYGPLGPMNVDNDTIITSQQGFYYLEMIDSLGCNVSSDPILVTDYATPFLNVLPDNVLCEPGETATLQVVTTSTATLVWDAPFAGSNALQQVVTAPGVYTVSVNACGIVTQLSVEVFGNTANAELVTPGPFTLCPGDAVVLEAMPGAVLYYWYPGPVFGPQITVDTSGTYLLVVSNAAGCQDSLHTEVTVLPEYNEITIEELDFCEGDSVVLFVTGDSVITWYADSAMTTVLGLGNELHLGELSEPMTVWVEQVVGPCSSGLIEVLVNVHQQPLPPVVSGNPLVCEGSALQLSTPLYPDTWYEWVAPNSVSYGTNEVVIDPVTMAQEGLWYVAVSNAGCAGFVLPFTVDVIDAASMSIGPDTIICPGGSAQFEVPSGFTQPIWHDGTSTPAFISSGGDVVLAAVDGNGCTVRDTANVAVFTFDQPLTATGDSICLGEDATLFANGSGIMSWFSDQSLMNVVHIGPEWFISQPTASATYYLQQNEGACASDLLPVVLTVIPVPVDADIAAPPYVCEGSDLVLTVTGATAPTGVWTTPSGTYQGASITIPNVAQGDAGTYTVVPSIGGCSGDAVSVEVDVISPDPLDLGPDTVFCEGGAIQFSLPAGYSDPVWSTSSTSLAINVVEAGAYSVQALDAQGCSVSDAILIDVVGCDPIIPNVVTPNGDGVNDGWILGPGGYVGAILDVYNRWGQLVWSGDVIRTGFRGNHMDNGEPLSEGTYYYVLHLTRGSGSVDDYTGHITLLR